MTWLNRILLALLITGAIAFLPNYEQLGSEDLARVRAERDALALSNQALRDEIRLIEAEVAALQPRGEGEGEGALDRELGRIAREDLNMIEPGEVVFEVHRPKETPER